VKGDQHTEIPLNRCIPTLRGGETLQCKGPGGGELLETCQSSAKRGAEVSLSAKWGRGQPEGSRID